VFAKFDDTRHIFLEAVSSLGTSVRRLKWAVWKVRSSVMGRRLIGIKVDK